MGGNVRKATGSEADRIMAVKARLIDNIKTEIDTGEITKPEILCLFAHITGMLIAMQDQHSMTPDEAIQLVYRNIEAGNTSIVEQIFEGIDEAKVC